MNLHPITACIWFPFDKLRAPKFVLFFNIWYNLSMNKQKILKTLEKFQRSSDKTRQQFFSAFEKKCFTELLKQKIPKLLLKWCKEYLSSIKPRYDQA